MVEYDLFAEIYDIWIADAAVVAQNAPFYLEEYLRTPGVVVELGVGKGRIAIEAARQGKAIVGVDSSTAMLAGCRERAAAAGVSDRLTLIQADFRDFTLPEPAELIAIPFHTIGHLVSLDDKRAALRQIHTQLAPGGRLIFDHFIFDPAAALRHATPQFHGEFIHPKTRREMLLWHIARYNPDAQSIRIVSWTDEISETGELVRRTYQRVGFSWLTPEQSRHLLEEAGFEIETLYGSFDRTPFSDTATHQIWVARKPA